jgi:hypothetical protein
MWLALTETIVGKSRAMPAGMALSPSRAHRRRPLVALLQSARHGDYLEQHVRNLKTGAKPLLLVDVDGVISLFGFRAGPPPHGSFHSIDGIPHFLSSRAAEHLLELWPLFDLVWASGWEEKANEYLPHLLGLPGPLPHLSFERSVGAANAHWKLDAIEAYCGTRPLAWIDDSLNDACHEWAGRRGAPTLLVQTEPERGLTHHEQGRLAQWARALARGGT